MPYVSVNGIELYYERTGRGEPVVLITGLAGDVSFWNRTVPLLSDGFDVIAVDNRGAGRTRYSGSFGVGDMADDVIALLDCLGIRRANLLGWSMGSHIALEAAARYPQRVRTLTLVACYLYRPARSAYILDYLSEGYTAGTVDGRTVAKVLNVLLRNQRFFEEADRKGRPIKEMPPPDPRGFRDQMRAVNGYRAELSAASVDVPTLSVHGLEDIMTEPSAGDEIAALIRDCEKIRIPGEGHVLRPESYIPCVRAFMERHRDGPRAPCGPPRPSRRWWTGSPGCRASPCPCSRGASPRPPPGSRVPDRRGT